MAIKASESGFFVKGDVKNMAAIEVKDKRYLLVAKNNDAMQFERIN